MIFSPCQPFLCRSALLPGESLASLLVRLAAMNAYQPLGMVASVGQACLPKRDALDRPKHTETYQILATLTGLTPLALYQATPHVFARTVTRPGHETATMVLPDGETVPLLPANRRHTQLRPAQRLCYCPRCLAEAPYYRLAWLPTAMTVCLHHRCLLVRDCQRCQAPLQVRDVIQGQCPQCRFDLSQAEVTNIGQDSFGLFAQTVRLSWLGLAPAQPESYWAASLPPQPPAVLHHLLEGIQRALLDIEPGWFYWHPTGGYDLSQPDLPATAYLLATTAFRAVVNWPQGWYAFLDAYQQRNDRTITHHVCQDFGHLYKSCLEGSWSSAPFHFVQEAFDYYLVERYPLATPLFYLGRYQASPQLAARLPCLPADEAAERLEMPVHALGRLLSAGFLTAYKRKLVKQTLFQPDFISRSAVLALQQRWAGGLPREDVLWLLGVSEPILLDLVDAGMLDVVQAGDQRYGRKSVLALLTRLTYHVAPLREIQPFARPLSDMAEALTHYGYRPATVVQLAQEHLIRFAWERRPLGRDVLWVSTEDLELRLELLDDNRPFITCLQLAHQWHLLPTTLAEWARKGLLPGTREPGLGWQFDRADVATFAHRYILLHQVAFQLKVSTSRLQRWVQQGRLPPVSGPAIDGCSRILFHRADVEQLSLSANR